MPTVIGIGGVFIFSNDPKRLAEWYAQYLGLKLIRDAEADNYYLSLWSRDVDDPSVKLQTVFAIMHAKDSLGPTRGEYMINYRVDDLDGLVAQLHTAGIATEPMTLQGDGQGRGKFTQLRDPEGNRIELWEHVG
jgi:glyoxylase I family protein